MDIISISGLCCLGGYFYFFKFFNTIKFSINIQTLEMIVRYIYTMSGNRDFTIAAACDMEHYPQVVMPLEQKTMRCALSTPQNLRKMVRTVIFCELICASYALYIY